MENFFDSFPADAFNVDQISIVKDTAERVLRGNSSIPITIDTKIEESPEQVVNLKEFLSSINEDKLYLQAQTSLTALNSKYLRSHTSDCYDCSESDSDDDFVDNSDDDDDDDQDDHDDADNDVLCSDCETTDQGASVSSQSTPSRRGDSDFKQSRFDRRCCDVNSLQCQKTCQFGQKCFSRITLSDQHRIFMDFWEQEGIELSTSARRDRLHDLLGSSRDEVSGNFRFSLGHNNIFICEYAMAVCLGFHLRYGTGSSHYSTQWINTRSQVLEKRSGMNAIGMRALSALEMKEGNKGKLSLKFAVAKQFIENYVFPATNVDSTPSPYLDNVKIIPHEGVGDFYLYYVYRCEEERRLKRQIAGSTTFRKAAFCVQYGLQIAGKKGKGAIKRFRYSRGRGNFSTCEFCNVVKSVLVRHGKAALPLTAQGLLLKLKFLHLHQQSQERDELEQRKVNILHMHFLAII